MMANGDPKPSLQTFDLLDLQKFTHEGVYSPTASKDFHLFFVGRDNTQTIFTDPDSINRFQTELISEHLIAQNQQAHIEPDATKRQSNPRQDESIPTQRQAQ
jgi:hypothetical protein